jgi:hypothetical protein
MSGEQQARLDMIDLVMKGLWEEIDRSPARLRADAADMVNLMALRELLVAADKPQSAQDKQDADRHAHDADFKTKLHASEARRIPRDDI